MPYLPAHVFSESNVTTRRALSLIEILVVVGIIFILVALLLPAIGVLRERVANTSARMMVQQVHAAITVYRGEDPLKRYPAGRPDRTMRWSQDGSGMADLLSIRGLAVNGSNALAVDGGDPVLVDPWKQPLMYIVDAHTNGDGVAIRPLDAAGDPVRVPEDVSDWNPPRGVPAKAMVPFPYVWSWGKPRSGSQLRSKAQQWIYVAQQATNP